MIKKELITMNMLKTFNEDINVTTSVHYVFEDVNFSSRFYSFLDMLECNTLRTSTAKRQITPEGIVWDDNVKSGGLRMMTQYHPSTHDGACGKLTIEGSELKVSRFKQCLNTYATFKDQD